MKGTSFIGAFVLNYMMVYMIDVKQQWLEKKTFGFQCFYNILQLLQCNDSILLELRRKANMPLNYSIISLH